MDPMSVYPFRHPQNSLEDRSPNVAAKRARRDGTNNASSKTEKISQRITRSQSQGKDNQLQLRTKRQSVVLMDVADSEKTQKVSKKALPAKEKRKAADTVAEFGPKRYKESVKSDEKPKISGSECSARRLPRIIEDKRPVLTQKTDL